MRLALRTARRAGVLAAAAAFCVAVGCGGTHAQSSSGDIIIAIPGVPGPYCVYGIEKRLGEQQGIERVDLLWEDEQIRIVLTAGSRLTEADVREAVEGSEYPYPYQVSRVPPP